MRNRWNRVLSFLCVMVMVFTMIPAGADPASVYSDWLGVDGSLEDSVTENGEKIYTFGEKKSVRLSALMQQLHLSTGSLWAIRLSVSDPTAVTLREEPGLLSDDWMITAERYFDEVTLEISAFWTTRRIQLRNPKPMIPAGETIQNENGVFAAFAPVPEGTELTVAAYEPTEELRALVQERAGDEALQAWMDISLMADGEKVESAAAVTLETNIVLPEAPVINGTTGQTTLREARLLHILPDGAAEELSVEVDTEDNEIVRLTFTTESFSAFALAYTVDFHYVMDGEAREISFSGGGAVSFTNLMADLGLYRAAGFETAADFTAEAGEVAFSDPSLVWVGKAEGDTTVGALREANGLQTVYSEELTEEDIQEINARPVRAGDWALISLLPFDTEERLTISMKNGDEFTVRVTDKQIRKIVRTVSGDQYEITVTYDESAGIPEGADLEAFELLAGDTYNGKTFEEYVSESESTLGLEAGSAGYIRLFDISIVDENGEKVQPLTPVSVKITLMDAESLGLSVVHFTEGRDHGDVMENTVEIVEAGKAVSFQADGFSIYGVVNTGETTDLDGKTFAIINMRTNNALQAEAQTNNNRLKAVNVTIKTENGKDYITANEDVSLWTFTDAGGGKYYIQSADGKYLNIINRAVTLSNTQQALNVVAGMGTHNGEIRITNNNGYGLYNNSGTAAGGFESNNSTNSTNSNNAWLVLHESVDLNTVYTADKISVQNLVDQQQVMIYRSVYNETDDMYEDYVIDGNGELVRAYDKGDQVTLRSAVSPVWTLTVYTDATTGEPNGYYEFYNAETRMYLCPKGDGTLVSSSKPGVTLNGRRDGEYNSTIEAWDSSSWAWYGYQVTRDESGNPKLESGTGNNSQEFSFASYAMPAPETLHPVETVDSSAAGITIRMFDFLYRDTITNVVGGNSYQEGNWYNNSGRASMRLVNGYPTFSNGSKSAATLFSSTYYKGYGNHLFLASVYNSTGYYEYNAFHNYAYYNQSTGDFTVYQEIGTPSNDNNYFYKRGNFLPFDTLEGRSKATNANLYEGDGSELSIVDPTNGGDLYLINNANFFFGMTMEFHFMQPKNGYYRGGPMIYEFNGDDDLWVYIDGVKILDIGGVHDALPGKINFATGEITYGANMTSPDIPRTIKDCFKKAGVFPDGTVWDETKVDLYFKGNTFVDYGSHTFNMFYLEHGAGASNLEMRFNLPVIEKGKFTVEKVIQGTTQEKFANVYFAYQAFAKDVSGNDVPFDGSSTVVYEGTSTPVQFYDNVEINGKTYDNVFYLKPGEAATFTAANEEVRYYAQELGIGTDYYDEVIVNDVQIDGQDVTEKDGIYPSTVDTVKNRARVTFSNRCSEKNLNELRITKQLADGCEDDGSTFEFRVQLENANGTLGPYSTGAYYIQNADGDYFRYIDGKLVNNGKTAIVASVAGNNGLIAGIPAGYTVVIKDLLAETDFHVEEIRVQQADGSSVILANSYWSLDSKTVVEDSCDESELSGTDWTGGTITADGQIRLDTDAEVIFVNRSKSFEQEVVIQGKKILKGRDPRADEFSFTLTEINLDGTPKEDGLTMTAGNQAGEEGKETGFTFGDIGYTMSDYYSNKQSDGSAYFYYVVQETIPEDAEGGMKDSVIYDQSSYLVIVRLWMEGDEPKAEWNAYPYEGGGVPADLRPGQMQENPTGVSA